MKKTLLFLVALVMVTNIFSQQIGGFSFKAYYVSTYDSGYTDKNDKEEIFTVSIRDSIANHILLDDGELYIAQNYKVIYWEENIKDDDNSAIRFTLKSCKSNIEYTYILVVLYEDMGLGYNTLLYDEDKDVFVGNVIDLSSCKE